MSSLSATQADGYYLPPEYFDSGQYKKQSKNQFAGSKGHNQFLQKGIVRFELPYKGVCAKCQKSVGRGTRYNAQKVNTGETYFTTPIWEFQMTCRNCQHPWKIRTNPQQRGFDYVEGVTIQAGQEDDAVVDAMVGATSVGRLEEAPATSLDRLESVARGARHTQTEIERLQALQRLQSQTTLEDARLNASIRLNFRTDRKLKRLKRHQASKVGWREGMEWLNTTVDDQVAAKATTFGQPHQDESQRFSKVRKSSIFGTSSTSSSSAKRRKRSTSGVPPRIAAAPETVSSHRFNTDFVDEGSDVEEDSKLLSDRTSKEPSMPAPPRAKQKIQLQSISSLVGGTNASSKNKPGSLTIVGTKDNDQSINGLQAMLAAYGSSGSDDSDDSDGGH